VSEYIGPFEIYVAKPQPARKPTPAEATALFDAVIRRTMQEKHIDYNRALVVLQSEAPELVTYFQTIRRIAK
jgi:hypothetical protein